MLVPQDKINLWWDDYLHASKYGSYLSALVIFGKLTGINPATFGATEKAAADLGIGPGDAVKLQRVASEQLAAEGAPLQMIPCLRANPDSWRRWPWHPELRRFASGARLGSRIDSRRRAAGAAPRQRGAIAPGPAGTSHV